MAERRMFAKSIIDSDMFLDMPVTAQLLYFQLGMRADDDGFINNPKRIMRDVRCSEDDMKMLVAKKYIIPFESGVIVIRHWRIHNYIKSDRYKPSMCEERDLVQANKNKVYEALDTTCLQNGSAMVPKCIQDGSNSDTQVRLGKVRLGKVSSVSEDTPTTQPKKPKKKFVPPTFEEVRAYILEKRLNVDAQKFFDYYDAGDWHDGNGKAVKNWKQKCLTWDKHDSSGKTEVKAKPMGNGVYKVSSFSGGEDVWKPTKIIR